MTGLNFKKNLIKNITYIANKKQPKKTANILQIYQVSKKVLNLGNKKYNKISISDSKNEYPAVIEEEYFCKILKEYNRKLTPHNSTGILINITNFRVCGYLNPSLHIAQFAMNLYEIQVIDGQGGGALLNQSGKRNFLNFNEMEQVKKLDIEVFNALNLLRKAMVRERIQEKKTHLKQLYKFNQEQYKKIEVNSEIQNGIIYCFDGQQRINNELYNKLQENKNSDDEFDNDDSDKQVNENDMSLFKVFEEANEINLEDFFKLENIKEEIQQKIIKAHKNQGEKIFILVTSTAILVQEIIFMTILRFLYGFVNGMTLPLSYVVISEIIPQLQRGRANICPVFFELLGKWYTMLLGYFFMSSFSQGNWRMMAFFNVIPCIIVLFGNHKYLKESPRFLLQNQQEQAIRIINEIGHMNKPALYTPLNETEINGLKKEAQRAKRAQLQNEVHIQDLFNYKNKQITIIFWTIGIFMNFMLSANLFLLPFLLAFENREMKDYAYTNGGDILALILVFYSIDRQNIGRKNSLIIAFSLQVLTMLLIYIYSIKFLILGQVISNFLQRICFQSLNVMVTENYNTQYRSMGVGNELF
ncbi:Major facilitator superfamily domain, general substrate transporter [Pseudocohnilembus persalinus]|uniref:Major facilitator superfamily domain, general substrate transporter n=1 Tax=Pseudocohnilembus persalinus TaxID=266149 RepID=A0A0V0QQJ4_PSEPJ|nr:Major facilitator superfamily domain, general substrate transporter [Pseudocohnilembus persalinus]|eukprot:KRX04553.1 Major facilitator superfamily domain, general substrate transporter [Pseudocohnilembus persalinus]